MLSEVREQVRAEPPLVVDDGSLPQLVSPALEPLRCELMEGRLRSRLDMLDALLGLPDARRTSARTFCSSSSARWRVQPSSGVPRVR